MEHKRFRQSVSGAVTSFVFAGAAIGALASIEGDSRRGRTVFDQHCAVCHATVAEYHKEGPSLVGIWGRRAGTIALFPRYKALKGSDVVWTAESLDAWLADPRGFVGGRDTAMNLKLADAQQRADVIAFLRTLR
jgi:cytochrome c